jgi:hypothetical protein
MFRKYAPVVGIRKATQIALASLCLAICSIIGGCGGSSGSTPTLTSIAITPANPSFQRSHY